MVCFFETFQILRAIFVAKIRLSIYRVYKVQDVYMGVSGTNNHMYSQQISQQAQAQFSQLRSKNTGLLSRNAIQQMKNSDIYSQYRQMRTQENSAINLQSLSETVAQYQQMGFNVDTNSLAAMYDSNGDGLLSGTELKQAERGLTSMYQNYMSQNSGLQQTYGATSSGTSQVGSSLTNIGSTISGIAGGLGQIFGSNNTSATNTTSTQMTPQSAWSQGSSIGSAIADFGKTIAGWFSKS